MREELRVFQDGLPDAGTRSNWNQLVEDFFPLEVSQLFFFDAEKIRSLAEDETSSQVLGTAVKSLLGLDIVERLITDSTVLQTRLAKRAGTPEHQAQVESLEQLLHEHQVALASLTTERAQPGEQAAAGGDGAEGGRGGVRRQRRASTGKHARSGTAASAK